MKYNSKDVGHSSKMTPYFQICHKYNNGESETILNNAVNEIKLNGIELIVLKCPVNDNLEIWNVTTPNIDFKNETKCMILIKKIVKKYKCDIRFRFPTFCKFQ